MEVFRIAGRKPLHGSVRASGSKIHPSAFAAALLSEEESILENVPELSDVLFMAQIVSELGADIERLGNNCWRINPGSIVHYALYELVRKMRASICLLGPLRHA